MAAMNRQCPYSRVSYASFRLHTYCRLLLTTIGVPSTQVSWRSFSSCESRPNRSPRSTKFPDQSGEATDSSFRTLPTSLPQNRIFTSDTLSQNGQRDPSRVRDPATSSEKPAGAPDRNFSASNNLIKSPIQIRKAKRAVRHARKAPPPSAIQKALKHNPWAKILASPPRRCPVSGVRTASGLLVEFGLVKHPDSSSLWVMPTGLLEDELQNSDEQRSTSSVDGDFDEPRDRKPLPSIRISNCPDFLSIPLLQKVTILPRLFPTRLTRPGGSISQNVQRNLVWRQDMADFVLRNLRAYATKWLKKSSLNDGRTATPRAWKVLNTDQNPTVHQLENALKELGDLENMTWGAVLVLGPGSTQLGELAENSNTEMAPDKRAVSDVEIPRNARSTETTERRLPDLIQLPNHASKVPIFDLRRLLSETNLDELRICHPLFQQHSLFFRPFRNITEQPLVALWKVKLYMTDDEDFPS